MTRRGRSGARSGSSSVSCYGVSGARRGWLARGATPRRRRRGSRRGGVPAPRGRGPAHVHGRRRAGLRGIQPGGRDRRPLRRPGRGDAGAARRGADRDHARTHRRRRDPARRGHGRGHGRRDVADDDRSRLLRRDRDVPGDLRRPPGARMDGGAESVVRRRSPSSCRTAASASCTAPRSCSCRATGPTRSTRPSAPASGSPSPRTRRVGRAFYRRGELHRLRGEYEAADHSYREASRYGQSPHPGLALLRYAQGQVDSGRDRRSARR